MISHIVAAQQAGCQSPCCFVKEIAQTDQCAHCCSPAYHPCGQELSKAGFSQFLHAHVSLNDGGKKTVFVQQCCIFVCGARLYMSLLGLYAEVSAWHVYRGYLVDTGQEFINSRGPGKDSEPFEFDTGMGVLPEAIDMSGIF